eukprot:2522211-Rhodomonas_salina.1
MHNQPLPFQIPPVRHIHLQVPLRRENGTENAQETVPRTHGQGYLTLEPAHRCWRARLLTPTTSSGQPYPGHAQ